MSAIALNGIETCELAASSYTEICRYVIREKSLRKHKKNNFQSIFYMIYLLNLCVFDSFGMYKPVA